MGTVYEALHSALGRRVALKVLHPAGSSTDAKLVEKARRRFLREGRVAAQVRHPNVVDVYDFGVADGLTFLVMEMVDGETLAQHLLREKKLSIEAAIDLLLPILSATAELHAAGIVHRDIKPANILLARGPVICPKLADFGVSWWDDGLPGITDSGALLGTLEYMAPELIRRDTHPNECADQYALGVTLYECVAGAKPFRGQSPYETMAAIVAGGPPSLSRYASEAPVAFDRIVLRALHRDPASRFQSVDDLAEALVPFGSAAAATAWRRDLGPFSRADGIAAELSVPRRRNRARRGVVRSALALGGCLAIVALAAAGVRTRTTRVAGRITPSSATAAGPAQQAFPPQPPLAPEPAIPSPPVESLSGKRDVDKLEARPPDSLKALRVGASARAPAVRAMTVSPSTTASTPPADPSLGDNNAPILDVP
jgi:hypothetical protein